jgi:23S rRNA (adenine2030-N6)-methyltransferase
MNYRHAYHAGNHADVLKHVILARAIGLMARKDKPFRIIDAHAGIGLYSLLSEQAGKTFEWREGVGRLFDQSGRRLALDNKAAEELLSPWREMVEAVNSRGKELEWYPGSPELSVLLTRPGDRMVFNELHPEDFATLSELYAREKRVRVTNTEAMIAVKANLPPTEKRGIVLIDPPYEKRDDERSAMSMLWHGQKRFATGCFMVWYPITGDGLSRRMEAIAREMNYPRMLQVEMLVRPAKVDGGLAGSGLIILNPPWPLAEELPVLLPALTQRLRQGSPSWKVEWINGE